MSDDALPPSSGERNTPVLGENSRARPGPSAPWGPSGVVGHYDVLKTLGVGGFGVVVKAFDQKLRRVVAIKMLRSDLAATSPARKRFVREARAAAAIRHENVVQIYAVEEGLVPYLVMEYVPGKTLQQHLDETGPLAAAEVARVGAQIARGLAAAHDTGVIHRDIKPANILLEWADGPRVKLTDFGLARAADDASLTQSGMAVGTPPYMAPEQARGERTDHRADLYSLGSVLYTMTTGRPPFRAPNTRAVLKRVAEDTPRSIREVMPETPAWLCAVIARLHAKQPRDRFQTAREVADLLDRCLADGSRAAVRFSDPARRRKWVGGAVAAALSVGLGLGGAGLFRPADPADAPDPSVPVHDAARVASSPPGPVAPPPPTRATEPTRPPPPPAAPAIDQVVADLRGRNPQHKGAVLPTVRDGRVVGLEVRDARQIQDITPLARLRDLERLTAQGAGFPDLGPLRGLPLRSLSFANSSAVRDLGPLAGMPLEDLNLWACPVADLSPLRGMPLRHLNCGGGGKKLDLAPLVGMPLNDLWLSNTRVDDLSLLAGLPLESLSVQQTPVHDLSPLRGMRLKVFNAGGSLVTDLSVLRGMPLEVLTLDFDPARDADLLRAIPTLVTINRTPAATFWAAVPAAAADAPRPAPPPARLCDEVFADLRRLNPKFEGPLDPAVKDGRVVGLKVEGAGDLTDAAPLGRMTDLVWLAAEGGGFADLRPFRGSPRLKYLYLNNNRAVGDLSPLAGLPLDTLKVWGYRGDDLSPLKGMPLRRLNCGGGVKRLDLGPLQGMPLNELYISMTLVDDLGPLKGMPLEVLHAEDTRVADLSPLRGMKIKELCLRRTQVADLSPLRGMPLEVLRADLDPKRDADILRSIKTLKEINNRPAAEFWTEVGRP